MSLTMKSYESPSGFATMTIDELFFINGGSGSSSASSCINTGLASITAPQSKPISISSSGITLTSNSGVSLSTTLNPSVSINTKKTGAFNMSQNGLGVIVQTPIGTVSAQTGVTISVKIPL